MTPAPNDAASTSTSSGPNGTSLAWVPWLQAGVTAMLVVLFLVIVAKTRQQNTTIRHLQERVEGLENSRSLERSTGLEQQVRSAVERLQAVERNSPRVDILSREVASLRAELAKLRSSSDKPEGASPRSDEPPVLPPVPPLKTPAPTN